MRILSLLILTFIAGTLWAQDYNAYQKKLFIKGADTLQYRILYPKNMKPGKKYPMVLFMHGAGERGNDNQKQLTHGGQLFLNQKNRKKYPAIVVFPQCPNGIMWTNRQKYKNKDGEWIFEFPVDDKAPWPALMVDQFVDEMIESGYVDESRLYIMGISMGGIGSLEFLYRFKDKYAAATIICGGHNAELSSTYKNKPIWFFHGGKDDVVPMHYSREVYEKVKRFNKKTQYTIYPEANHNSWDPALAEPKLLKWLFSNRKK